MKHITIILLVTAIACTNQKQVHTASSENQSLSKSDTAIYPYKPSYSASFEMGNPELSKIILSIWKDWDNNQLENSFQYLADTLRMSFPDGTRFRGHKRKVWDEVKQIRNVYNKVESKVAAWLPFRSIDKNDYWVAVWGTEYHTDKNGIRDSIDLHEIWAFDKHNKVKFLSQYDALFNLKQKGRKR